MIKQSFNDIANYTGLSSIPYNIVSYLINADDDIWKLINYNSTDALSQPSLTSDEKRALIYTGNGVTTDYRVFLQGYNSDGNETAQTQLRILTYRIKPNSLYIGKATIEIQIISHDSLMMVGYNDILVNRVELILEKIISILNGKSFSGVNNIEFSTNNEGVYVKFAQLYYSGYVLRMSCNIG
ncbi:hypothetical protein [Clostridium sp.]|uniref:hypothetical protein n=1 Tax=Clostridium sp. TaxID=1506 RepID=UPI0026072324|nr:hypothetical protein [Clostridium sp.]